MKKDFGILYLGQFSKWVMLLVYSFHGFVTAILGFNIISLSSSLETAYGLDSGDISIVSALGGLSIIVSYFPSNYIMKRLGIKWGIFIGYSIALLGLFVQLQMDKHIWCLHLGYFLVRVGALSGIAAKGPMASNWFPENQRIIALFIAQLAIYGGFGGYGFLITLYVNNQGQMTPKQIKDGINGYLVLLMMLTGACMALSFLIFRSKPTPKEDYGAEEERRTLKYVVERNTKQLNLEAVDYDIDDHDIDESEQSISLDSRADLQSNLNFTPKKKEASFFSLLSALFKDKMFNLMFFGAILGAGAIGGQNSVIMLGVFGFPESDAVTLSTPGTLGALTGQILFLFFLKGRKGGVFYLQITTMMLCMSYFTYFWSFSQTFTTVRIFKFCYSFWNGPQIPLINDIMIRYFKRIGREDYILVGTSAIGLWRHLVASMMGAYIGIVLKKESQFRSWISGLSITYAIGISFFADFFIERWLKKNRIDLYSNSTPKKQVK